MDQAHPLTLAVALALGACGGEAPPPTGQDPLIVADGGVTDAGVDLSALPYARAVVSFAPGEGAGFGADRLPDVVLGPPHGKGVAAGSTDVLSLGRAGEIVLDLGAFADGPGDDLVVFENAFWASGEPAGVFAELGEVAVSTDAVSWRAFACNPARDGRIAWPGCAGWSPALEYDAVAVVPLDPALSGGDGFDLAEVGLSEARYLRVRDVGADGAAPTAGFDLDAVGVVYPRR